MGIGPRDWDVMTVEEADHYLAWLDEYLTQMEKTAQQAKRRR